jgi:hypothetical protein
VTGKRGGGRSGKRGGGRLGKRGGGRLGKRGEGRSGKRGGGDDEEGFRELTVRCYQKVEDCCGRHLGLLDGLIFLLASMQFVFFCF